MSVSAPSAPTYVQIETSAGSIELELYADRAPRTVYNFVELSKLGYYDGTTFHRVIEHFMLQGGDPTGSGLGGESIFGGKFEDEISPDLKHTGAGIISMANSGPNSNGSQFFITLAPCPWLDGKHSIFGRVSKGMRVVQRLGSTATTKDDCPEVTLEVISITPK
jgi:peptidyl-prolyl cis-trans isomerase-like 1